MSAESPAKAALTDFYVGAGKEEPWDNNRVSLMSCNRKSSVSPVCGRSTVTLGFP